MSINPYEVFKADIPDQPPPRWQAQAAVSGPAMALMIVAGLSMGLLAIAIPLDFWLLASGIAERLDRGGIDPTLRITVRLLWSLLILAASGYVFYGAWQMKRLTNYGHARAAAIVACIPCVGPCCLLGIPFGAWALTVLGRPEVFKSFQS